ncbi:MAG: Ig-like domain-containing protein, partial [bacterium]|nr:Ig-like domain-containing protein [bacterium]
MPVTSAINVIFSKAMDPLTVTTATFTLSHGLAPVAGTVTYSGLTATFTPASPLIPSANYTATITTGVKDLAGNALTNNFVLAFTTGLVPVALRSADTFAVLAGSTVTSTGATIITGDLGVSSGTAVSGFPPGTVNGTMYRGVGSAAGQAQLDLTTAYNDAAGRSTGPVSVAGNLGGQTLAPGLYKSTSSLEISSGDLTLDAQGNADAVFIFQMASTLTTTSGRQVILSGGAKAANIYWQVGSSATLGTTSVFKGNILADQSITLNTGATLDGRALTRIGAVTLDSNTINRPALVDTTSPTVSSTIPANAATGVAINSSIAVTFSKPLNPLTVTTATITLKQGITPVSGTVTYAGVTAIFAPAVALASSTLYTATINTGAKDLAGNALASEFIWIFSTGVAPDTTPPTVSSTIPANAATGVAINSAMTAIFSEALNPLTVTTSTFTLKQGTTPVSGAVTYAGVTATFTPAASLAPSTVYTATVTTGAKDLAGNALSSNYTLSFTTGGGGGGGNPVYTTPPTVSSSIPANLATGVAINSAMSGVFSEALDPLTVTTGTFTLKHGVTPVSGAVTYAGVTATFIPLSNLLPGTLYTATITTGVKDLAGNALAVDKVWTFTTGVAPDTTAPTVSSTIPANLATG